MAVVNPNNTSHTIRLIPRLYSDSLNVSNYILEDNSNYVLESGDNFTFSYSEIVFNLYNEKTDESENVENNISVVDGYLLINFDYTFNEDDKYQIKITDAIDNNIILYRGSLFATSQKTQEYNAVNGYYEWK